MLISLTQRHPGVSPPTPVLVGSDLILYVEPAGGTGASVFLAGGKRLDVLEEPDLILDGIDAAHDEGARKKAAVERRKAREERLAAEAKRKADLEAAAAKTLADRAEEEAERHRVAAQGAARRAEAARAAAAGGKPVPPPADLTEDGRPRQSPQIPAGLIGPATVGNVAGSLAGAPTGVGTAEAGKTPAPAGTVPATVETPATPTPPTTPAPSGGSSTPPLPVKPPPHGEQQQTPTGKKGDKSSKS